MKCGLRNPLEGTVVAPESAKDCWRFNFLKVFCCCFFLLFFKVVLWADDLFFYTTETTFSKHLLSVFSKSNFFLPRNMPKLHHKVCNGQNIPHGSPNFWNYHFLSNFTDNLCSFSQIWDLFFYVYFLFCFLL